jgi:uncharacterized protein (TIGR00730 family)
MPLRRVCVFAGSSLGVDPEFAAVAHELGQELARRTIALVYGGASAGLMGVMADAALAAGGEVIGVIPHGVLRSEAGHPGLSDLRVVGSMHERKALMAELGDGFVALPGGLGTLEELIEQLTWAKLGIHAKPVVALDVGGFFDPLLALLARSNAAGFFDERSLALLTRVSSVDAALMHLESAVRQSGPMASDSG